MRTGGSVLFHSPSSRAVWVAPAVSGSCWVGCAILLPGSLLFARVNSPETVTAGRLSQHAVPNEPGMPPLGPWVGVRVGGWEPRPGMSSLSPGLPTHSRFSPSASPPSPFFVNWGRGEGSDCL